MKKINIKLEKIYTIILYINIVLLNIFIGSAHAEPRTALQTLIILEALIYIIIAKIQKKQKILIKGKIDIAVITMTAITAIPLILKTYCSLSDEINTCISYLAVYSMYIIARNVITTPKRKNALINITLISSILIVVFGIDMSEFNIFKKFYDITNAPQIEYFRMTSTFGYSNSTFAYLTALILVALGKFIETKNKKISGLYATYIQIAMYGFYYCNSRAGMVIFALVFIAYILKLKDIDKIVPVVFLTIFAYVSVDIFDSIKLLHHTPVMLVFEIFISLLISYCVGILSLMLSKKIKIKDGRKTTITIVIATIVISIIYVLIAQNFSKPKEMELKYDYATLYTLKTNTNYTVKFNYTYEGTEPITIQILQIDNKRNEKILYNETINQYGKNIEKEISIETGEVDYALFEIYTSKNSEKKFILNKVYLNGKEDIVNYKYVPNELMRLIKTFKLGNISISERISMYKSGLKLVKDHPIIGNGARTYENLFEKVREYAYHTMEVHCYYLDMLMDYGIIGLIAFLSIIVITIYNFIKRKDKNNITDVSMFIGWIFILIHTVFDFDLAYMVTLSNFYMMIVLICKDDKEIKKESKILEMVVCIIMFCIVASNVLYKLPGERLYKEKKYKEAMKYIPYSEDNMYEYLESREDKSGIDLNQRKKVLIRYLTYEKNENQFSEIKSLYNVSINLIKDNNIDEGIEGIEKIITMIQNDEVMAKYDCVNNEKWKEFVANMSEDFANMEKETSSNKIKILAEKIENLK